MEAVLSLPASGGRYPTLTHCGSLLIKTIQILPDCLSSAKDSSPIQMSMSLTHHQHKDLKLWSRINTLAERQFNGQVQ